MVIEIEAMHNQLLPNSMRKRQTSKAKAKSRQTSTALKDVTAQQPTEEQTTSNNISQAWLRENVPDILVPLSNKFIFNPPNWYAFHGIPNMPGPGIFDIAALLSQASLTTCRRPESYELF